MKKLISILIILLSVSFAFAQTEVVEVTGVGFGDEEKKARQDAIDDALRLAVGQAMGVHVKSTTTVQNYVTLEDAISTRSKGYVKKYTIIKETPLSNKYEVTISAEVSLEPMIEDAATLAQMIGGVNFIVIYDARFLTEVENEQYDFAYERINEKLNDKGYSRTEAALFNKTIKQISDTSEIGFLNSVGLYTNSEFIIQIKKMHVKTEVKAGGLFATQVTMDVKAYDNCNWRNLGTVIFKSDWKIHKDEKFSVRNAIADAIDLYFDRLMLQFNKDIGRWVAEGAPYEVRFYGFELTDDDFYDYADLLLEDPDNVGEPDVVGVGNYYRIVFHSKKGSYKFGRLCYKKAKEVENIKLQLPSTRIKYKRQFSLTPQNVVPEEIKAKMKILELMKSQ